MGITKREIASELGVSKRTVANYIEKLGLGNHVSRNGNTDFLDDFAAAAIADALKNPGKPSRQPADAPAAPAPDSLVDSLAAQLEIERSRNAELMEALAAECDRAARAGPGTSRRGSFSYIGAGPMAMPPAAASVKNGEGQNPPRCVSSVDQPTCESCRPCFGGQHRQQG